MFSARPPGNAEHTSWLRAALPTTTVLTHAMQSFSVLVRGKSPRNIQGSRADLPHSAVRCDPRPQNQKWQPFSKSCTISYPRLPNPAGSSSRFGCAPRTYRPSPPHRRASTLSTRCTLPTFPLSERECQPGCFADTTTQRGDGLKWCDRPSL